MDYKKDEIKQHILDTIEDYETRDVYELHNEMFNMDYYIIGRYEAKKWLGNQVFNVIDYIKECENNHFGEVNTDFSEPEHVVNMYTYIVGEEMLWEMCDELELTDC